MNDSFDPETLQLLDGTKEVRIETRRDEGAPKHRTIVWVVVVDKTVFVRSVRGSDGRWYREVSANPTAALHVEDHRIPVRAVQETDETTVEQVSEAYRGKYGRNWPGPTQAMVQPGVLPTTLKLEPA